MKHRWMGLLLAGVITACDAAPLRVSLMDRSDGMVRFSVENASELDVRSATVLVRYEASRPEAPRVDTLRYETTRNASGEIPFVRAGEETFIPHQLPAGASAPSAEVVEVEFWDGTVWRGN